MKYYYLLILTLLAICSCGKLPDERFAIQDKNGKWGYIDTTGKVVIAANYHAVRPFSEGLAAVRKDGTYGYIDTEGKEVLKDIYDLAYEFDQGMALVYKDCKPYFIDTKGKILFEHSYMEMSPFNKYGVSVVRSEKLLYGLIDRSGKQLAPCVYKKIDPFFCGVATVYKNTEDYDAGVLNAQGKLIVGFGKFRHIPNFEDGYAIVESKDGRRVIFDSLGKKLQLKKGWEEHHFSFSAHDGKIPLQIECVDPDSLAKFDDYFRQEVVIDPAGNILFSSKRWAEIRSFAEDRAFARDHNGRYHLIDETGTVIKTPKIDKLDPINGSRFIDGVAIVGIHGQWSLLNSDGKLMSYLPKDAYYISKRCGDEIHYRSENGLIRIWNFRTNQKAKTKVKSIENPESTATLRKAYIDENQYAAVWINRQGKIVKRFPKVVLNEKAPLNIDYMSAVKHVDAWDMGVDFIEALSKVSGSTSWYENAIWRQSNDPTVRSNKQLYMKVDPATKTCRVVNASSETVYFPRSGGGLPIRMQAKDKKGKWRNIEYLETLYTCGIGGGRMSLSSGNFWSIPTTNYTGSFKTQCRMVLVTYDSYENGQRKVIYSNAFGGTINPGQFRMRLDSYRGWGAWEPYED